METVVSVVAGLLCGALAGAPYVAAFAYVRRRHPASILPGCVALAVSIAVFALGVAGAWKYLGGSLVSFAFASAGVFLVLVIMSVAWFLKKGRD